MKTTLAVCIIVVCVFATLYQAVRDSSFLDPSHSWTSVPSSGTVIAASR
jgi:hypothetical protein